MLKRKLHWWNINSNVHKLRTPAAQVRNISYKIWVRFLEDNTESSKGEGEQSKYVKAKEGMGFHDHEVGRNANAAGSGEVASQSGQAQSQHPVGTWTVTE